MWHEVGLCLLAGLHLGASIAMKLMNRKGEISAVEAKRAFSALLDHVEEGQEFVVTRHGKPVARLVPYMRDPVLVSAAAAAERIRSRAKTLKLGKFQWKKWKVERDRGRP